MQLDVEESTPASNMKKMAKKCDMGPHYFLPNQICTYCINGYIYKYRILPIIGASPNRGAPIVWGTQYFPEGLK